MATADDPAPSVWDRAGRKERSTLTADQIVAEALRLLDAEGIEALTMRKLAARLEVGAPSLYWHVRNRDELVVLLIDVVYGEIALPDPDGGEPWDEAVRRAAADMRAVMVRHPWVASVLDHLSGALLGPNATRLAERMLAVLVGAGFDVREAEQAFNAVGAYVTGVGMAEAAWHNWIARQGQDAEQWLAASHQVAEQAAADYPLLRSVLERYQEVDVATVMDDDFAYGLDRLLDGLAARLEAVTGR